MGDAAVDEPISPTINPVLDNTLPPWLSLPPRDNQFGDGVALLQRAHASGIDKYRRLMPSMSDYPPGWPGPKPTDDEMGLAPMNVFNCESQPMASCVRSLIAVQTLRATSTQAIGTPLGVCLIPPATK
jgi:hypothetical protein